MSNKYAKGRPRRPHDLLKIPVCYRLPRWLINWLKHQKNEGLKMSSAEIIEQSIKNTHQISPTDECVTVLTKRDRTCTSKRS